MYADKAEVFNKLINDIGKHTDDGTLPELAPDVLRTNREENSVDIGVTLSNMINVRNDDIRDDSTVQVDVRNLPEEEVD